MEDIDVLDYGQHVVWHPQEGVQLTDECPGTLAPLEEVL